VDVRTTLLTGARNLLYLSVVPIQLLASVPPQIAALSERWFVPEEDVRAAYRQLSQEILKLKARQQRLDALETENAQLRRFLDASRAISDQVLIAELVEVSLDPFTHRILINRGLGDGVYEGQPVLDAEGVMGQVTRVMPTNAAVTLITDPSHGMPVAVQRNGLRAVLLGTGRADELRLGFVSRSADIQVGDLLVSSGLGGRFPAGYPVARISEIRAEKGGMFVDAIAVPVARVEQTRNVILVWQGIEKTDPGARDGGK
jgi:rod shape-determining protein MreC